MVNNVSNIETNISSVTNNSNFTVWFSFNYPIINLKSEKEFQTEMDNFNMLTKDCLGDWKKREAVLKKFGGIVQGNYSMNQDFLKLLNTKYFNNLFIQISDLRTSLMKEACLVLVFISSFYGTLFENTAIKLFHCDYLYKIAASQNRVIADNSSNCMLGILKNISFMKFSNSVALTGKIILKISEQHNSKITTIRLKVVQHLFFCLVVYEYDVCKKYFDCIETVIVKLSHDSNSDVRLFARKLYFKYTELNPDSMINNYLENNVIKHIRDEKIKIEEGQYDIYEDIGNMYEFIQSSTTCNNSSFLSEFRNSGNLKSELDISKKHSSSENKFKNNKEKSEMSEKIIYNDSSVNIEKKLERFSLDDSSFEKNNVLINKKSVEKSKKNLINEFKENSKIENSIHYQSKIKNDERQITGTGSNLNKFTKNKDSSSINNSGYREYDNINFNSNQYSNEIENEKKNLLQNSNSNNTGKIINNLMDKQSNLQDTNYKMKFFNNKSTSNNEKNIDGKNELYINSETLVSNCIYLAKSEDLNNKLNAFELANSNINKILKDYNDINKDLLTNFIQAHIDNLQIGYNKLSLLIIKSLTKISFYLTNSISELQFKQIASILINNMSLEDAIIVHSSNSLLDVLLQKVDNNIIFDSVINSIFIQSNEEQISISIDLIKNMIHNLEDSLTDFLKTFQLISKIIFVIQKNVNESTKVKILEIIEHIIKIWKNEFKHITDNLKSNEKSLLISFTLQYKPSLKMYLINEVEDNNKIDGFKNVNLKDINSGKQKLNSDQEYDYNNKIVNKSYQSNTNNTNNTIVNNNTSFKESTDPNKQLIVTLSNMDYKSFINHLLKEKSNTEKFLFSLTKISDDKISFMLKRLKMLIELNFNIIKPYVSLLFNRCLYMAERANSEENNVIELLEMIYERYSNEFYLQISSKYLNERNSLLIMKCILTQISNIINSISSDSILVLIPSFIDSLIGCLENSKSEVRIMAVEIIVDLYFFVGEHFKVYLNSLNNNQRNLVNIFISKRQNQ